LPEFADGGALPAAHLSAVELKGVQPERLGSGETVGAGRYVTQSLAQEVQDRLGPGGGVVAARAAGRPVRSLFLRAGAEVGGGQAVETTALLLPCPYALNPFSSGMNLQPAASNTLSVSGEGQVLVRGRSGGGLMWIAQSSHIQRLTRLATWLWVRPSARCIAGEAPANARRVPDGACVRYWHRVIYANNSGGR